VGDRASRLEVAALSPDDFANLASGVESLVTAGAVIAGGVWALRRFGIAREGHPHIQFSADVTFITSHADWWIVELVAVVENKGRARHEIREFDFDLYALGEADPVEPAAEYGNQVRFPQLVTRGTWLTGDYNYFFIEPGVAAKYSHIARIPMTARAVVLHAWFRYPDGRHGHTAERTIACPSPSTDGEATADSAPGDPARRTHVT